MPDDEYLADELRRALEHAPRRPPSQRIWALERHVARQRFRRPLRRAAVVAAAAALFLIGFGVATLSIGGGQGRPTNAAPALAANVRAEVARLRAAITIGDTAQIEQIATNLRDDLQQLPAADRVAITHEAEPVLRRAKQRARGSSPPTLSTSSTTLGTSTTQSTATTTTTSTTTTTTPTASTETTLAGNTRDVGAGAVESTAGASPIGSAQLP